jgi:hypothetical protein
MITAMKPEHPVRGPEGFAVLLLAAPALIGVGVVGVYLRQRGSVLSTAQADVAARLSLPGFGRT